MLTEEVVVDRSLWDRSSQAKQARKKSPRLSVSLRDRSRRQMRNYQRRVRNTPTKDYSNSPALAKSSSERVRVKLADGSTGKRTVIWWPDVAKVLLMSELTMQRAWVNRKMPRPSCVGTAYRGVKKYYLLSEVLEFVRLFADSDILYLTTTNPVTSSLFAVAQMRRDEEDVPR